MRCMTFYITTIAKDSNSMSFLEDTCFYTTNKLLLDKFMSQYNDATFDIYELDGDNIIEVAEEFNCLPQNRRNKRTVDINDRLELFVSATLPDISFISSANYIEYGIETHTQLSDYILQILVTSYINLMYLVPYMRYSDELQDFLKFVCVYITRYIIACNADIYSLPHQEISKLGLNRDDVFSDIIDENLIYYMQEFGWGDE